MHNLREYNANVMTGHISHSFGLDAVIGGIFEEVGAEEEYRRIRRDCTLVSELVNESLMYCIYKGKNIAQAKGLQHPKPTNRTRAVVFDFDGTLTSGKASKTTWESLWVKLGYPIEECQKLHMRFNRQEISHAEWCETTERSFQKKNLHRDDVEAVAGAIRLIDGIEETFKALRQKDIKIYIVSGSILLIIQRVLGNLYQYIDGIKANVFRFDSRGLLERIIGTKYDFQGKSEYILKIANELEISPRDVLFVGNSANDQFAYLSGARTLCINPILTDVSNTTIWNECIMPCSDLREILRFLG